MGDGVHQSASGRVYIDRALPGETVRATPQKETAGVVRADLIEIVTPSVHRAAPPCRYYDVCGGCTLQHASETFYRDWKVNVVRAALEKRGVQPEVWLDPVFLPPGHRRRVTFAAFKKGNAVTLGYFRRRTHHVTDIAACLIADPAVMDLRAKLVTALVPVLQEGKAADIFIQAVDGQSELVITGPIGKKGSPDLHVHEALGQLAQTANIARISWRRREHGPVETMLEAKPLFAKFGRLDVALPPLAFLQPTKAGQDALVAAVMEALPVSGRFADLFCGCGTFSGPMLERGTVDAYDSVGPAIDALDKAKGVRPLKAVRRDLFRNPLRPDEIKHYDAIVVDPPRAGAQEQSALLAAGGAPRLVAVSCNPATFARDAQILVAGGYVLKSIRVIDQFTWSHHVELVGVFVRP